MSSRKPAYLGALIENNEHNSPGADYFVKKHLHNILAKEKDIDALLLARTHYPLLLNKIQQFLPAGIAVVSQGEIVAQSLVDYLHRHPEIEQRCSKQGRAYFYTTDSTEDFDNHASIFFGQRLQSRHLAL